MGLGDIYEGPNAQRIISGGGPTLQRGFESLPSMESQYLQNQNQRQANTDQAYNSPARGATEHETAIGNHIRDMMGHDDPNIPPQWRERLKQEMAQGGMAGGGQPPSMGQPTQGAIQNLGSSLGSSMGGDGPSSFSLNAQTPAAYGGYDLPDTTGAAKPPQVPYAYQPTPEPVYQPDSERIQGGLNSKPMAGYNPPPRQIGKAGPMTNGDVQKYMHMAPFFKVEADSKKAAKPGRDFIAEEDNKAKNRKLLEDQKSKNKGTLQDDQQAARKEETDKQLARQWQQTIWAHEDRIKSINERIANGSATHADSMELKKYLGEIAANAKLRSSIPSLADDQKAIDQENELEKNAKESLIKLNQQQANRPIQGTSTTSSTSKTTRAPQGKTQSDAMRWALDPANANDPYLPGVKRKLDIK